MFKQNKWEQWWDSLPSHTKEYLKKQPIWHDKDLCKAFVVGIIVGVMIGLCM